MKVAADEQIGTVSGIIETPDDGLWLNEMRGIVQIPPEEMRRFMTDPHYPVKYRRFDYLDGLPGAPQMTFTNSTAVQAGDGRLWFATNNGLAWIDPAHVVRNIVPPPVSILSIGSENGRQPMSSGVRLAAGTHTLQIDYTALSLSIPERVEFRYKLEGMDRGWQNAGARRQAFYTSLRPGRYRFRVIACNNDGLWNEQGAVLDFSVAPAWYQTNWFLVLCIAAGIVVVWAAYRLRLRQLARAMSARFNERLAERTRMARDLHDTFLQTIQGSKLVTDHALKPSADPIRMREALEQLSIWLARAAQEGRAALNSLRTATTQTNDLSDALQRVTRDDLIPGSMAVTVSVVGDAREMHPIVRDEIYRIGYEAIRNACMHSRASQLEVDLRYAHDLTLRVSDNGTGIDPAIADKGKDSHFGLQGIRERAARIGGTLTLRSSSLSGTEIKLVVPGDIVFRRTALVQQPLLTKIRALFKGTDRNSYRD